VIVKTTKSVTRRLLIQSPELRAEALREAVGGCIDSAFWAELLDGLRVREPWAGEVLRPVAFELPYEIWYKLKELPHSEGCTSFVDPLHVRRALQLYLLILELSGRGTAK